MIPVSLDRGQPPTGAAIGGLVDPPSCAASTPQYPVHGLDRRPASGIQDRPLPTALQAVLVTTYNAAASGTTATVTSVKKDRNGTNALARRGRACPPRRRQAPRRPSSASYAGS